MDKVIIFGVNLFSSVVLQSILKEKKAEVLGFTLNREYITSNLFEGLPVIPFEDLDSHFDMKDVKIAITIGYSNMNANRATVYQKCKEKGYNIYTFISNDAYVMTKAIGEGCIILPQSYIGPYVKIGCCTHIWPSAHLGHHNEIGDFTHISGGASIGGGTSIGSFCFIGINSTIVNGIFIGNHTLIGAGSIITKSTEGYYAYAGAPARCIGQSSRVIKFVK